MYCKHCGCLVTDNSNICNNCYKDIFTGNRFCQRCGKKVSKVKNNCTGCGGNLRLSVELTEKRNSEDGTQDLIKQILFYIFLVFFLISIVFFLKFLITTDGYAKQSSLMYSTRFFIFALVFAIFSKFINIEDK